MTTAQTTCAHDDCKCRMAVHEAVPRDGMSYCSERCADNRGCDHHGCNCGNFPTQQPAPVT